MQHACSKNLQAWQESRISRICRVCDLPSCVYCSWIESFFRSSDDDLPEQLVPSTYVMYCYFCLYAYNITSVSTPKSVIAKRKAKKPDPIIEIDDDSLYVLATNNSINGSQLYRSEVPLSHAGKKPWVVSDDLPTQPTPSMYVLFMFLFFLCLQY
jgi:hypothetical protein